MINCAVADDILLYKKLSCCPKNSQIIRSRKPKAFPKIEWQQFLGIGSKFVCLVGIGSRCLSRYARIKKRSIHTINFYEINKIGVFHNKCFYN